MKAKRPFASRPDAQPAIGAGGTAIGLPMDGGSETLAEGSG
jgi:hypothetical protein